MKKALSLILIVLMVAALLAPAALAASDITVYVTVTDNGETAVGQVSGEPMVAVPVTLPTGSTVSDALKALHEKECAGGAAGYAVTTMEYFGTKSSYLSKWFGRPLDFTDGSKTVTAWRNHSMSSTIDSVLRDGDVVDACVYTIVSSQNFSYAYYGLAYMDYHTVEAGVGESFTVGVWRSVMDMMTFQYNQEPYTNTQVLVNGVPSNFRVQADGSLTMSFDVPGDYYVSVGGDEAYGTAAMKVVVSDGATFTGHTILGPGRVAASGLNGEAGGAPITVYVTVTDCDNYAKSEVDGSNLIDIPVTVPEGATLDDVLDALHGIACSDGNEGYSSGAMEMYGTEAYYITKWFGDVADTMQGATYSASAWVNQDMMSNLATPVKDGDRVNAVRYKMTDPTMFLFEYYGLSYFDYPSAEAAPGEEVSLHAFTQGLSSFMSTKYHPVPLTNFTVYVNGEDTGLTTDAAGEVKLSFDAPGVYDVLAVGGTTSAAAATRITVKEGASFANQSGIVSMDDVLAGNLSAPGHGTGPDVTVYVTVTDKGNYVKSDLTGEYLIAVPVTVPGGSTVDDVLQKFHAENSASGALGYSSYTMDMWGTKMYSIGNWFGKPINSMDGSDYSVTAWLNRDAMSTLAQTVKDGDIIDAVIYGVKSSMEWSYSYWGLSYFDFPQVTAGVNDEIVLKAYHSTMDATTFMWNTYQSADMTVFVNGEKRTEKVGSDGTLKLSFDKAGTYYVLAQPGDDSYAAAAVKIVIEEGASFEDNAPATEPTNVMKTANAKLDYGKVLTYLGIAVAVVIIILAVVRVLKNKKKDETDGEGK